MILDQNFLHDGVACFATDADLPSTNCIDNLSAFADIGEGLSPMVRAALLTAVTGGTSIQAVLADCDTEEGSYLDVISGKVVLVAAALAGKVLLDIKLPPGLQRYIRVLFRNAGANAAGTADAFVYSGR